MTTPQPYVFGYGSLVSPGSVEATLGHEVDRSTFSHAILDDWERAWNVGSDRSSHPERTFVLADDTVYDGVTVVLGIEARDGRRCNGSVFSVTGSDLSLLDVRERNYERRDVTAQVSWAGKPNNCTVFTYVPIESAKRRVSEAMERGRPLNVRRGYAELVERAFSDIGKLGSYRRTTPAVPYPLQSMQAMIDPVLAPPIRGSGDE
ncbi:gamma-glutamylcyclotransferase family protein [Micromonospora sp. NPDC000089]|uniref:gamma-glutamylcyclotransferase family protein n=1 Tax=unclassified Micromonospora TaxID=2617518 RepID=UPI0036834D72